MVLFVMADGVEGELALATERNFMAMHGGPHRVLADKSGLLAGVEFPLLSFDDRPSRGQVEEALWWFWWEIRSVVKAWARGRWWVAAQSLGPVRNRCLLLARAAGEDDPRAVLAATFAPLDKAALAEAI